MPQPAPPAMHASMVMILIFAAIGCRSAAPASHNNLEAVAKSRLGSHYTISYNVAHTYALCQQTPAGDHHNRTYKFIVVETSSNAITNEGSFRNGYVKWIDDTTLEVSSSGLDEKVSKQLIKPGEPKS